MNDTQICRILRDEMVKLNSLNNTQRIKYLAGKKVIRKYKYRNIYSEGVYLLNNFIVAKKLKKDMQGYTFWRNEINSLKRVLNEKNFPQLVAADPDNLIIYMTYCGNTILSGKFNINNYKQQLRFIAKTLHAKQINPNDILPKNICVLNGTLKLIDFGLANINPAETQKSINKLNLIINNYMEKR